MGTVGINFGAATSGAGFDVASTVTSILAVASAIETPWKAQLTALQAQDTALSGLGTNLASLSTAVSSLTAFDGVLAQKQGASSNTNVLTLTAASSSAVSGSHTITVNQLAQTSSQYSAAIAATDTLRGSLTFGSGTSAQTLTLDSTNNTLSTLASAINTGSYGVSASVISDATGSRLSLVSQTSGAAGQINLAASLTDATTAKSIAFKTGQTGQDAQINIDGLDTTSASNTVTGAIPGVTFQLLSKAVGVPVQVQITNDNSSIETAVQSVVTAYNAVAAGIKTQEGTDSAGAAEPLYGNPTLSYLQTQLLGSLFAGAGSGAIRDLSQLGVTVNQDGTLALNVATLDGALNSNFSDVAGFFQNSGSFGQTFSRTLNALGSASPTGSISLALTQNKSQESDINTNVTNEDARIAAEKITLTTELTTANQILQSIPQQLNEQTQIYDAITGYKGGN
jgi:flagellar hook-associated protein 2